MVTLFRAHKPPGDGSGSEDPSPLCQGAQRAPRQGLVEQCDTLLYLNRQGGTRSPALHKLTAGILLCTESHLASLRVRHIPGMRNVAADRMSRGGVLADEWPFNSEVAKAMCRKFGTPVADLFCSAQNALCPLWFSLRSTDEPPLGGTSLHSFRRADVLGRCDQCTHGFTFVVVSVWTKHQDGVAFGYVSFLILQAFPLTLPLEWWPGYKGQLEDSSPISVGLPCWKYIYRPGLALAVSQ